MKEICKDLADCSLNMNKQIVGEIATYEFIVNDKRFGQDTKKLAKETLKTLYQQRNEYAKQAEYYRARHSAPEGCTRTIGWGKARP